MITFKELYERKVNVIQRKKQARRMSKLAKSPSFQLKKKRALLKFRSADKIDAEIFYNKYDIFKSLYKWYAWFGIMMLLLLIVEIIKPMKEI